MSKPLPHVHRARSPYLSIGLAGLIVMLWLVSLIDAFTIHLSHLPLVVILLKILIRGFFHTGLFIVTHEAIHRNISHHRWLNDTFGYLTSFLYALLPYKILARNHKLHHRFPGTDLDPDHSESDTHNFLSWYFKFMKTYQADGQGWVSLTGMGITFCILVSLHIPILNLVLFWIIPMVTSSLQLFTFGVFLPHRKKVGGYEDVHRINSIHFPVFWSFVTCYHFGYHWEHHQYPHLPWYQLPQAYWAEKT